MPPIDRRRFLVLAGSSALYLTLRPHLTWAGRAARANPPLQSWTLSPEPPGNTLEIARSLIGAAVLAPNHWNNQPWLFEVDGASIRLVADATRALPVTDPDQKSMMISLGAALENLLVAARAYGLRPKVSYFPHQGAGGVVADVTWSGGDARRDRHMFAAIPERRTNRREYDGRGIIMQNRAQLTAQVQEGFRLHWLDDRETLNAIADVARDAVASRIRDPRAQGELYSWMRFGDQAARRGDGVTVDALEYGGFSNWLAGRYFNPNSWFLKFGAHSGGKQARSLIRSSGALALLTAAPGGPSQWVLGGQAYERLALKATQLGIAHQPINAPIELERHRHEIMARFGAVGEDPLMLVRLGHAKRPPASMRRSVALVTSFRNS
jgi:nitroreductase